MIDIPFWRIIEQGNPEMMHEPRIPEGRLGAGFNYQWRVALYLLVELKAASDHGLSSDRSIAGFLQRFVQLPDADLLLEGYPKEPREDIEIEGPGKDGLKCRVRFQVKTKREEHLLHIDSDPIASIVSAALTDSQQESPLIIVSNTGIAETGPLGQTLPNVLRRLQVSANKGKWRKRGEDASELAGHVYFWHLPQAAFLDRVLLAAFGWNEANVAAAIERIAIESTTAGGQCRRLQLALADLDPYMPARNNHSGWLKRFNGEFEAKYLNANGLSRPLEAFLDECYVTRAIDEKLSERTQALNIASIGDQLTLIQKSRRSNSTDEGVDEQADVTLQTLNGFIQDLQYYGVVREIHGRLDRLATSLDGNQQLAKGPYSGLVSTAQEFKRQLAGYRRSVLLLGAGGDGKTLAALRLCRSAKWYCAVRASSIRAPTAEGVVALLSEHSGAPAGTILDQLARLNEDIGSGFVLIDGLDELHGCDERAILTLLQSIDLWPGTFRVLVTCREDYVESLRAATRRAFESWKAQTEKCAAIVYVPSISHETPARWLQAYCKWYKIPEGFIPTAWSALSHRFRVRDLHYVFRALVELLRLEPTLRFLQSDATAIYACALVNDCKGRASAELSREDVEKRIGSIAWAYWQQRQTRSSVSFMDLQAAATGAAKVVLDTLVERCGELIVTKTWQASEVEWRMPDASLFYVARSLFQDERRPRDTESLRAMLQSLTEAFGRRASDVVIHFLRECQINLRSRDEPEVGRTFGHSTMVPPAVIEMMIDGIQSRGHLYIAFLVFRFEKGDPFAFEAQPSNSDYQEISPDTAADYLGALGRILVEKHEQDARSRVQRVIDVASQIDRDVGDFSSAQLDYLVGEFVGRILAYPPERDGFHISLVTLLEEIQEPFQEVTSQIVVWLKLVLARRREPEFFEEFLLLLGNCRVGRFSREVSRSAANRLVELELCEALLCGSSRIYGAREFFVRKDIINAFAHSLLSKERFLNVFQKLESGELEQRRNGLFLAQQYFKRTPEDTWRVVFMRIQKEESTEVVSTAVAICLEARRNQRRTRIEARYELISKISLVRRDEILNLVERELAGLKTAESFLAYLPRIRGIVDVWNEVRKFVWKVGESLNRPAVEQSVVNEFVSICMQEPEMDAFVALAIRLLKALGRSDEASALALQAGQP